MLPNPRTGWPCPHHSAGRGAGEGGFNAHGLQAGRGPGSRSRQPGCSSQCAPHSTKQPPQLLPGCPPEPQHPGRPLPAPSRSTKQLEPALPCTPQLLLLPSGAGCSNHFPMASSYCSLPPGLPPAEPFQSDPMSSCSLQHQATPQLATSHTLAGPHTADRPARWLRPRGHPDRLTRGGQSRWF